MTLEPRYLAASTFINDSIYLIGRNDILGSHSGVTELDETQTYTLKRSTKITLTNGTQKEYDLL